MDIIKALIINVLREKFFGLLRTDQAYESYTGQRSSCIVIGDKRRTLFDNLDDSTHFGADPR